MTHVNSHQSRSGSPLLEASLDHVSAFVYTSKSLIRYNNRGESIHLHTRVPKNLQKTVTTGYNQESDKYMI